MPNKQVPFYTQEEINDFHPFSPCDHLPCPQCGSHLKAGLNVLKTLIFLECDPQGDEQGCGLAWVVDFDGHIPDKEIPDFLKKNKGV